MKEMNKKAQLTIFIIITILIIIVLTLLLLKEINIKSMFSEESPINQIEECIKDSIKEDIEILSMQGGSINPEFYYLYEDNKVEYLCYTGQYYSRCIVQKPLLKKSIEKELEKSVEDNFGKCINTIKNSLEKKGYEVVVKLSKTSVELVPDTILIKSDSEIEIIKEKTENYKGININIQSDLYDLTMLASDIINSEAEYGDFETLSQMINKPQFKIEKRIQGNGTRIYTLTSRDSMDKFRFASRSIVFPSGVLGE